MKMFAGFQRSDQEIESGASAHRVLCKKIIVSF